MFKLKLRILEIQINRLKRNCKFVLKFTINKDCLQRIKLQQIITLKIINNYKKVKKKKIIMIKILIVVIKTIKMKNKIIIKMIKINRINNQRIKNYNSQIKSKKK